MSTNVLPHEKVLLQARVEQGERENVDAADAMNHAINDGNQWHDNSAYDEAVERMKRIDSIYGPISRLLAESIEVDYPDPDDTEVCLGSVVAVQQSGDKFNLLVVGQLKTGTEVYEVEWARESNSDIFVLSPDSPMGAAVLGARVGDSVVFEINGNSQSIEIEAVNQSWLKEKFSEPQ